MKKGLIKYSLIIMLLGAGALIYIYAQKNFIPGNIKSSNNDGVTESEKPDDIGFLTDDDPWKEMDKLVANYYNKQGVSYKGLIRVIDDNGNKEKIVEERKFEYSAAGRGMYYRLGDMEFINKPEMILIVDHLNKIISLSEHDIENNNNAKIFDIKEFKTIMEKSKAKAKITQLGDQKILTIENIVDPQIQGYRIYYNPETYQISKMLIGILRLSPLSDDNSGIEEMQSSPNVKNDNANSIDNEIETYTYYVEMIYNEMILLNVSEKTFRPEDKFITKNKSTIGLTPAFSNYELVSNGNVISETEEAKDEQK